MDDIVARLRQRAAGTPHPKTGVMILSDHLLAQAADEIERLRHRISDAGDVVSAAYWLLAWTNQHLLTDDPRDIAARLRDLDPVHLNTSEGNLVRALRTYVGDRTGMMAPLDGMTVAKHNDISPACDCQRPPTHCSEDCPIHGWDNGVTPAQ